MHSDLERVIALQRLDSAAEDARRRLAEEPERRKVLEDRLTAGRQQVAEAKERLSANQAARRALEKDLAVVQGRLSKFRDQLMEVKTNREYQAMQKEIETAQAEVRSGEETILERMLEADDLNALVKRAEANLNAEQRAVEDESRALEAELAELTATRERIATERETLARAIDARVLETFDLVARRRHGVAVAEAKDGHCTICHVRLRPQIFNTVRRNDSIIQCDSCQRILYFSDPRPTDALTQSTP